MIKRPDKTTEDHSDDNRCQRSTRTQNGQAVYGLGMIGALIYFVSTASSFWAGVLGILKAIVWPAFLVYELMRYLHM